MRESKQMFECFSVKLNALATQQSMCCTIKEKYNILETEVWEFYVFKKSYVFFVFFLSHAIYNLSLCFEEQQLF